MDKEVSKRLLAAAGLPVVPGACVRAHVWRTDPDGVADAIVSELGLPLFVKPACLGSSVGISKVRSADELAPAIDEAARYDEKVLVERAVDARELEIAVLGNDEPAASVPGEIVPKAEFYDYASKYVDESTELLVPAPVPDAIVERMQQMALDAFRALEGQGLARVDFFLAKDGDELWINELNSLPGFTEGSMYPRLWEASGLPYPALLDRLIELALERARAKSGLVRHYRVG